MKLVKVFGLFVVLHLVGWVGAHIYRTANPDTVLVVVDTSFAMKPQFVDMQRWVDDFAAGSRYQTVLVGSDKAMLGEYADLKSTETLFRTAFGRLSADQLKRYDATEARQRILLSDGSVTPSGWDIVEFKE